MTIKEAIKTIELAIAEVEWVYPIDYAAAFDVAVSALRAKEEKLSGGWIDVVDVIEREPAVDAVPVRHGRWIKRGYACGENEYECSVCHETEWRTSASRMKYCMFCGARMDGGDKNDE